MIGQKGMKKEKKKRHAHNPVSVKDDDIIQGKFFIFVTEPWAKSNISLYIFKYIYVYTRLVELWTWTCKDLSSPQMWLLKRNASSGQIIVTGTLRPSFFT